MALNIKVRKWTKDTVTRETHPVPVWTTPLMEMTELTEQLRKEQDAGKISGYELRLEGE